MTPTFAQRLKDKSRATFRALGRFAPGRGGRARALRWSLVGVTAVLAAGILWLYFLDWNTMRGPLARYASYRLGRQVRIEGDLDVRLFRLTPLVLVSGLTVANPSWVGRDPAAKIPRMTLSFRLLPLFVGKLILPSVELDEPDIQIVRDKQKRTNWDFGHSNNGWKLPPIHRFLVGNGQLKIDDQLRKIEFRGTISSQESAIGGASAFQLTGQGTLNGHNFLAEIHGGPLINVDESRPYNFAADIHSGATHIVGYGAFPKPFDLGQFWTKATFSGTNLSDLYYLTGVAFPGTPPYRLTGTLSRNGPVYKFFQFSGTVGESDLRGDLTVQADVDPSYLTAVLRSHQLRFQDLGALIGAAPPPGAVASSSTLLPDTPLHLERIRQTDADVEYDAESVKSRDFPLRGLHVHVVADKGVLSLKPVAFEFLRGKFSGSLKIDARKELARTDIDARITDMSLKQFFSGNPPPFDGVLQARVVAHGEGNSVHKLGSTADGAVTMAVPRGKIRKLFAELTGINLLNSIGLLLTNDKSEVGVRCAVAHFDVHDGVMHAQPLIIDTEPVLVEGSGSVDLGHETLDLTVSGKPKEFRLGRVHVPITISGPLAAPGIGVKPEAVTLQGGGAVALGALINPFAALLAFIDPGLVKDANCGALAADAAHGPAPVKAHRRVTKSPKARPAKKHVAPFH